MCTYSFLTKAHTNQIHAVFWCIQLLLIKMELFYDLLFFLKFVTKCANLLLTKFTTLSAELFLFKLMLVRGPLLMLKLLLHHFTRDLNGRSSAYIHSQQWKLLHSVREEPLSIQPCFHTHRLFILSTSYPLPIHCLSASIYLNTTHLTQSSMIFITSPGSLFTPYLNSLTYPLTIHHRLLLHSPSPSLCLHLLSSLTFVSLPIQFASPSLNPIPLPLQSSYPPFLRPFLSIQSTPIPISLSTSTYLVSLPLLVSQSLHFLWNTHPLSSLSPNYPPHSFYTHHLHPSLPF